jgi:hypothetical protein
LDDASHNEAADHFTAAVNSSAFTSEAENPIHLKYKVFVVVRGYYSIENTFHVQLALCAVLWVGPEVFVANREPEAVSYPPEGR